MSLSGLVHFWYLTCVRMFITWIVSQFHVFSAGTATSVSWWNISSPCCLSRAARPLLLTVLTTAASLTGRSLCQNWTWLHYCRHTRLQRFTKHTHTHTHTHTHKLTHTQAHILLFWFSPFFQCISKGFFPASLNVAFNSPADCRACFYETPNKPEWGGAIVQSSKDGAKWFH